MHSFFCGRLPASYIGKGTCQRDVQFCPAARPGPGACSWFHSKSLELFHICFFSSKRHHTWGFLVVYCWRVVPPQKHAAFTFQNWTQTIMFFSSRSYGFLFGVCNIGHVRRGCISIGAAWSDLPGIAPLAYKFDFFGVISTQGLKS